MSVLRRTGCPTFNRASACWGSENSTKMGVTDWSEATGAPAPRTCPSSTCRMAMRPSKGAWIDFLSIVVLRVFTAAWACL